MTSSSSSQMEERRKRRLLAHAVCLLWNRRKPEKRRAAAGGDTKRQRRFLRHGIFAVATRPAFASPLPYPTNLPLPPPSWQRRTLLLCLLRPLTPTTCHPLPLSCWRRSLCHPPRTPYYLFSRTFPLLPHTMARCTHTLHFTTHLTPTPL